MLKSVVVEWNMKPRPSLCKTCPKESKDQFGIESELALGLPRSL